MTLLLNFKISEELDQQEPFDSAKGDVLDFHYKNLSGGEKAAFDLLLDGLCKG